MQVAKCRIVDLPNPSRPIEVSASIMSIVSTSFASRSKIPGSLQLLSALATALLILILGFDNSNIWPQRTSMKWGCNVKDSKGPKATSFPEESAIDPLQELQNALETMQSRYFKIWLGTWPRAIDWTAAVLGTHVSATLTTLARQLDVELKHTTTCFG